MNPRLPSVIAAALLGAALLRPDGLAAVPPGGAPGVHSQDALAILERAAERYLSLDGFCADFRQVMEVTLLRQTTRSRGELCQARADRFDMRFTEPEGDRLVADGSDLWIYFPSSDAGQVFRRRLADAGGHFDFHREFLSEPGERYAAVLEGREELNDREVHVLLLEPRVPSPYRKARLWIDTDEHLIRKLEIHEDSESIRTLELSNLRLNPPLSPDRFEFIPPEGVQVIRR